jgi:hypothetical protein
MNKHLLVRVLFILVLILIPFDKIINREIINRVLGKHF